VEKQETPEGVEDGSHRLVVMTGDDWKMRRTFYRFDLRRSGDDRH